MIVACRGAPAGCIGCHAVLPSSYSHDLRGASFPG
jgi:hypothetical protein